MPCLGVAERGPQRWQGSRCPRWLLSPLVIGSREGEEESHRDKHAVLPPWGASPPAPCGGEGFPGLGPGGVGAVGVWKAGTGGTWLCG